MHSHRRPHFHLTICCLLFLAAACATAPAPAESAAETPAAPPADAAPAARTDAAARTLCWATQEEVTLVVGASPPGARRVLRLGLEPAAGRIVNQALRVDPNPDLPPRLFEVAWRVEGDRFTVEDADQRVSGGGTLAGEPWAWTGWTAETRLTSGIRIQEEAAIRDDGVLVVDRRVFGPDGGAVMTLHEEGEPLAPEECTRRLAEAAPPAD